jgi:hypothetical protein
MMNIVTFHFNKSRLSDNNGTLISNMRRGWKVHCSRTRYNTHMISVRHSARGDFLISTQIHLFRNCCAYFNKMQHS